MSTRHSTAWRTLAWDLIRSQADTTTYSGQDLGLLDNPLADSPKVASGKGFIVVKVVKVAREGQYVSLCKTRSS